MTAGDPLTDVRAVEEATRRLADRVAALGEEAGREPSRLPGWSRAHVLSHLAGHAEAQARVALAAARGELVDPYPGGAAGRAEQIEAGARRPIGELVAEAHRTARALTGIWRELPAEVWQRPTRALRGTRPLARSVTARWVEVEVHHVDLGLGYEPGHWSAGFVAAALEYTMAGLPARRDPDRPAPAGGWLVRAADLGLVYLIDTSGPEATVSALADDAATDSARPGWQRVEGGGAQVLAWMLGRSGAVLSAAPDGESTARSTSGGSPEALALPALFPFP